MRWLLLSLQVGIDFHIIFHISFLVATLRVIIVTSGLSYSLQMHSISSRKKIFFQKKIGELFRKEILARGGSRSALESFVAFRGRKPNIKALLRHSGLAN